MAPDHHMPASARRTGPGALGALIRPQLWRTGVHRGTGRHNSAGRESRSGGVDSPETERGGQVVAWMACRMTLVTTPGSEIMDKCGAFTSVMWACAFSSMASCNASGMAWSTVPTTAQDGMVSQAGTPVGSVRALRAIGA